MRLPPSARAVLAERDNRALEVQLLAVPFPDRDLRSESFSFGAIGLDVTLPPQIE